MTSVTAPEKDQLTRDFPTRPEQIEPARRSLAYLMAMEPKVINNKVFIYPLGGKS